ncbi:MAG TPA: phosphoribosylglycinamide formyltransferase [Candidatus Polarisedimenticolia bacterium]|nr:phosphoribosylglycinamide formyltransferase [Candidatus Polarisedimenticolia bacterium]
MKADGRIGILISGRGSNMEAIVRAAESGRIGALVAVVLSNRSDAEGLRKAQEHGIETVVVDSRSDASRDEHDRRMVAALEERRVDLVCLAGYMKVLTPVFLKAFAGRILNVHPSLLPAFPGLDAQRQALEHGVRLAGATVHLVDSGVDTGPIVLQAAVPVEPEDTPASLSERILKEEHRIYPEAVRLFFEDRLRVEGRRVRILPRADR